MQSNGGSRNEREYLAETLEPRALYSGAPVDVPVEAPEVPEASGEFDHIAIIETTADQVHVIQSGSIALDPLAPETSFLSQEEAIEKVREEVVSIDIFGPTDPIEPGMFQVQALATLQDGSLYDISSYLEHIVSIDVSQVGASQVEYVGEGNFFSYGHRDDTQGVIQFGYTSVEGEKHIGIEVSFGQVQYAHSSALYAVSLDQVYADFGRDPQDIPAPAGSDVIPTIPTIHAANLPDTVITLTKSNTGARSIEDAIENYNDGVHQELVRGWRGLYVRSGTSSVGVGEAVRLQLIATTKSGDMYDVSDFATFDLDEELTEVPGHKGVFYNDGQTKREGMYAQIKYRYTADGQYHRGMTVYLTAKGGDYEDHWRANDIDKKSRYLDSIHATIQGTESMELPLGRRGRMVDTDVAQAGDTVSFDVLGTYDRNRQRRYGQTTTDINEFSQICMMPLADGSGFADFVRDNGDGTFTIGQPTENTELRFKITYGRHEIIRSVYVLKQPPIQDFIVYVNGHKLDANHPNMQGGRFRIIEGAGIHAQIFADYGADRPLVDVTNQYDLGGDRYVNPGLLQAYARDTRGEDYQTITYEYAGDDLVSSGTSKYVRMYLSVYDHDEQFGGDVDNRYGRGNGAVNTLILTRDQAEGRAPMPTGEYIIDGKTVFLGSESDASTPEQKQNTLQTFLDSHTIISPTIFIDTGDMSMQDGEPSPRVWYLTSTNDPIDLSDRISLQKTVIDGYLHFTLEHDFHVSGKTLQVYSDPILVASPDTSSSDDIFEQLQTLSDSTSHSYEDDLALVLDLRSRAPEAIKNELNSLSDNQLVLLYRFGLIEERLPAGSFLLSETDGGFIGTENKITSHYNVTARARFYVQYAQTGNLTENYPAQIWVEVVDADSHKLTSRKIDLVSQLHKETVVAMLLEGMELEPGVSGFIIEDQFTTPAKIPIDFDESLLEQVLYHIQNFATQQMERKIFTSYAPKEEMVFHVNGEKKLLYAYPNVDYGSGENRVYNNTTLNRSDPDHQCTQLILRYLDEIHDLDPVNLGNGQNVVENILLHPHLLDRFDVVLDGSKKPTVGAIISMQTKASGIGHVAIVNGINMELDGNSMTISLIEQNMAYVPDTAKSINEKVGREVHFTLGEDGLWRGTHKMGETNYKITGWANIK